MMIRPFDLRDVSLVAQLENQGTTLNAELALTQRPRPLQSALASVLSMNIRGMRTYVCRGASGQRAGRLSGLAQLRPRRGTTRGFITFIAPALNGGGVDAVWLDLLEYIGVDAPRIGLQHLIAEAPEDGEEVEVLRRAGFAIYLRQDILQLSAERLRPIDLTERVLRGATESDAWAIQQLYFNTAPRLAHLAEGVPRSDRSGARGYVYYEKGELAAYVEVRRGPRGAWFSLFVHPDAESRASYIMKHVLAELGATRDRPIFAGVRRYQEWLRRPLESLGFERFGASVLMVKHLVAHVMAPDLAQAQALEARAKVTPT